MTKWKKRTFKRHHDIGDITIVLNYQTGTVSSNRTIGSMPLVETGHKTFKSYAEYLESEEYEEVEQCFQH
ncbi:hypothetical protein [Paenilisteria newyorkensis]|uniref:hypothetical protein n=1 Tax=Listeria newyorkensis TaxID=1497681 RepID=UPI000740D834|nr:hypothetical protein [Listeria newyorkensis]